MMNPVKELNALTREFLDIQSANIECNRRMNEFGSKLVEFITRMQKEIESHK